MANDINLIPPPDIEKKKKANRKAMWVGLIAVVLILVGYFGVYSLLERNGQLARELESVKVNESEYQDTVKAYHDLIDQINEGKAKLNSLAGNLPEAFGWSGFLDDIEGCMPADVSFTSMEYRDQGLYIRGDYRHEVDLSRLLVKLRGLDMIESARVLSVAQNVDQTTYEFEMQCDLAASVYTQASDPAPGEQGDGTGDGGSQEGAES